MNSMLDKSFGSLVRKKRENLDMTQLDLAHKLGYPQSTVSRLERGQRSPTLRELLVLAKALNSSLSDLLADFENDVSGAKETASMVMEPAVPYHAVSVFREALANEDAVLAQLAAHGVRFLGKPTRPAVFKLDLEDTLLSALRFAHEPRLFETLPSLVLEHSLDLDWNKLVSAAFVFQLQNRLGMVVSAALELKKSAPHLPKDTWQVLEAVYQKLAGARLDREEVLGPKPRTHEGLEYLTKRTPPWLRAWHALGTVDVESMSRHLAR